MSQELTEDIVSIQRDFTEVFGTPQGQRVLAKILQFCAIDEVIKTPEPSILATAMGQKNVGNQILNLMGRRVQDLPEIRPHAPRRR